MRDIVLNTASKSVIHCGGGAFEEHAKKLVGRQLFIVTDTNVFALYRNLLWDTFGDFSSFILTAGETSKTYSNLIAILKEMLAKGMKRNCTVVAFGGGVVGDIAGLAAALYMRGVNLVQIPTTLLAQVDSSVGGKTAVDIGNVKNAVGTFYQPQEVIVDPVFLKTLPEREFRCGLGEIVKYGALSGEIYDMLTSCEDLKDKEFLDEVTYACILHKAKVVESDEKDLGGARKSLNLGHTTGHALELYYRRKSHGEFVLIGMYYELYIAQKYGICGGQYAETLKKLILEVLGKVPAYHDIESAANLAAYDKKNDDENISLIVPKCRGEYAELKLSLKEYAGLLKECAESI